MQLRMKAKRPRRIREHDDRSDPATAARLYEKLITDDKVNLVISSLGSATAATGSAVAEKHKVIMINGGGAAEAIQQRGFKYVLQTAARISSYADGIVPMIEKYKINPNVKADTWEHKQ